MAKKPEKPAPDATTRPNPAISTTIIKQDTILDGVRTCSTALQNVGPAIVLIENQGWRLIGMAPTPVHTVILVFRQRPVPTVPRVDAPGAETVETG